MAVSLRIVGIYYDRDDIAYEPGMTVKKVLDYARDNPHPEPDVTAFGYQPGRLTIGDNKGKGSVSSFYAEYRQPFKSETGKILRSPGVYYLAEELPPPRLHRSTKRPPLQPGNFTYLQDGYKREMLFTCQTNRA